MIEQTTHNRYPVGVDINNSHNPSDAARRAAIYDEYDASGYDPNGADLFVASYADRLDYALERRRRADARDDRVGDGMAVEATRLLKDLEDEAVAAQAEWQERLDRLSEKDKLYAQAVQDWTMAELRRRVEDRGYDYDQHDEQAYLEMMDVLGQLVAELERDGEDDNLIELAATWRQEVAAELTVHTVHTAKSADDTSDTYRLAA